MTTRVNAARGQLTSLLMLHQTNWQEWTGENAHRQCQQDAKTIFDYLVERLPEPTVRHLTDLFVANKPTPEVRSLLDQMFDGKTD